MSPSWALKGPISFIGGGDAPKMNEQESIEVQIVHHPNTYSRKSCLIYSEKVDHRRSNLPIYFQKRSER
jgi:hypothetical protein